MTKLALADSAFFYGIMSDWWRGGDVPKFPVEVGRTFASWPAYLRNILQISGHDEAD